MCVWGGGGGGVGDYELIFSFLNQNNIMGTQNNRLKEMVLLRTHNMFNLLMYL